MIKVVDKSKNGVYSSNMELVDSFTDYSSKNLDFDKPVTIELLDDEENAKNPLGMTAYYSPEEMKIVVYVTGRHLKDILRSISHELIHHVQNCRGDLDHTDDTKLGYAQRDSHMRDMETEAYNSGNIMNFRDFEDIYKQGKHKMSKLKENRLKKLNGLLMGQEVLNEEVIAVALKFAGKANHQKAADKKCREKGFDGGRMISAFRAPSPEGSGQYKCMKCPEGSAPGKATPNSLNPMGCGFADGTEPSEEELTRGVRFALSAIGLDLDGTEPSAEEFGGMSLAGTGGRQLGQQFTPVPQSTRTASPAGKTSGKRRRRKRKCPKLPLRKGCTGELVKKIQKLLIYVGFGRQLGATGADGDYGSRTKKAVEAFQKDEGDLKVDGIAGKNTVEALKDVAKDIRSDVGLGRKKAVAKDASRKTATASPAGPDAPPAARPTRMTRVEAMRRAKEDIVPKLRRVRTRSYKRGLVRYLMIGLRELLDVQKMDPAKAYETLLSIFGRGGVKYITPTYSGDSASPREDRIKLSNAWKRGYENALNKTLEEL